MEIVTSPVVELILLLLLPSQLWLSTDAGGNGRQNYMATVGSEEVSRGGFASCARYATVYQPGK